MTTSEDRSLAVNSLGDRKAAFIEPDPNTILMASKVILPYLVGSIDANSAAKFACAVNCQPCSEPFSKDQWLQKLSLPNEKELENLFSKAEG